MALITRISRLFHADINAVLDKIEDPELLLNQAIREMEESISNIGRQLILVELEQQNVYNKEKEIQHTLTELEKQLKLCFESDKEDLARSMIRRKLEASHYLKTLSTKLSHYSETTTKLKAQINEYQSQLNSLKQKAEIYNREQSAVMPEWEYHSTSIQDEDIDIAFLDEKRKWSQS